MLTTLLQDLRYGVRMLVKTPAFTFVAVISLACVMNEETWDSGLRSQESKALGHFRTCKGCGEF